MIWVYNQSILIIRGEEFEKKRSTSKSGVIFADATSQITIGKANFNNNAAVSGGALYLKNGATLSNTTFNSNNASSQGGGIYLSPSSLSLNNTTLNQNQVNSGGGALFIAAFIVPYIFVMSPALLFIDTQLVDIILIVITSIIGLFGVSAGLAGFVYTKMPIWQRVLSIIGGLLLIYPGIVTDIAGVALVGTVLALQYLNGKKQKEQATA